MQELVDQRRFGMERATIRTACFCRVHTHMIRKLKSGKYRLYSRSKDPSTGRARNLGTFDTRAQAQQHERAIQYFKRRG